MSSRPPLRSSSAARAAVARQRAAGLRADRDAALARAREAQDAARRSAAELERERQHFAQVARVAAHDLAEPLLTVTSYLALLQKRYGGRLGPDADEFIRHAVGGAERMLALVEDLAATARGAGSGRPLVAVELDPVAAAAVAGLQGRIAETGADVRLGPLPVVRGDRRELEQVLQNLLANALKFVEPGAVPRVRVGAEPRTEAGTPGWAVHVEDEGIGVDPAQADRIFEQGHRLPAAASYEGTGTGLAICAQVVDRHGGRIWVEPAPGGGSRFVVWLPSA